MPARNRGYSLRWEYIIILSWPKTWDPMSPYVIFLHLRAIENSVILMKMGYMSVKNLNNLYISVI